MSKIFLLPIGGVKEDEYADKLVQLQRKVNVRKNILINQGVKRKSFDKSHLVDELKGHEGKCCKHKPEAIKKLKTLNLVLDTQLLMTQNNVKELEKKIKELEKQENLFEEKYTRLYNKYNLLKEKYDNLNKSK